jgi:hypothetical protein
MAMKYVHRKKVETGMMKVENDCVIVEKKIIMRYVFVANNVTSKDKTF